MAQEWLQVARFHFDRRHYSAPIHSTPSPLTPPPPPPPPLLATPPSPPHFKCDDDEPPRPTILDAAALAAKYSKAASQRVSVSLTRCRNVSKPKGAKPGLVNINGDVTTIKLDMKAEAGRLERLEATLSGGAETST